MRLNRSIQSILGGAMFLASLTPVAPVHAEGEYPADYKASKPAEKGETNVLNRVIAVATYMNDKLTAAGGEGSPMCYRNCVTVPYNDVLKCIESKGGYSSTESCEKDAANKMAACDPKCK